MTTSANNEELVHSFRFASFALPNLAAVCRSTPNFTATKLQLFMDALVLRHFSAKISDICGEFSLKCNPGLEIRLIRDVFSNCETCKICNIS